jgi:hypothetical protein
MGRMIIGLRVCVSVIGVLLVGCSGGELGPEPSEGFGSTAQEWGVVSCAMVEPDVVVTEDLHAYTPAGYNTCYKSFVVDLHDWDEESEDFMYVDWADTPPTTRSACERAWLGGIVYELVGDEWVQLGPTQHAYGEWQSSGICWTPRISWTTNDWENTLFVEGGSYRFAATARPFYGAASTRALSFSNFDG